MEKNNRPPDATIVALKNCLEWLAECERLGWSVTVLPDLEALWWKYHNPSGTWKL